MTTSLWSSAFRWGKSDPVRVEVRFAYLAAEVSESANRIAQAPMIAGISGKFSLYSLKRHKLRRFSRKTVVAQLYRNHGISFRYPTDWTLTEEHVGATIAVNVQSPQSTFWSLWIMRDCPEPDEMVESAIAAFSDEYDEVDFFHSDDELCEFPCRKCEVEFVSLELNNLATVRAFQTQEFSILILSEGTDLELEELQEDLESITLSLECGLDDDVALGNP